LFFSLVIIFRQISNNVVQLGKNIFELFFQKSITCVADFMRILNKLTDRVFGRSRQRRKVRVQHALLFENSTLEVLGEVGGRQEGRK
jgi:uncharacterized membrane protein